MYAVIKTGGKQYKVQENDVLFIEKLDVEAGQTVTFDEVVAVGGDDGFKSGAPFVEGASVTATAVKNGKAKMIEADCPDKLCMHQKAVSKNHESIICLPNKVVVEVESSENSKYDAVTN